MFIYRALESELAWTALQLELRADERLAAPCAERNARGILHWIYGRSDVTQRRTSSQSKILRGRLVTDTVATWPIACHVWLLCVSCVSYGRLAVSNC